MKWLKLYFKKDHNVLSYSLLGLQIKTYANPKFKSKGKTVKGPSQSIAAEVVGFRSQRLALVDRCSPCDMVT